LVVTGFRSSREREDRHGRSYQHQLDDSGDRRPSRRTARFSQHAAADGNGAWGVSTHPVRLFTRNQAITALTLAERLASGYGDDDPMTGRLIRLTTALTVVAIAGVAAIISYRHACGLVTSHGETGLTARQLPFTIDGLTWAASMVVLDASRRHHPVPSWPGGA